MEILEKKEMQEEFKYSEELSVNKNNLINLLEYFNIIKKLINVLIFNSTC